ncbi:hypothetical protein XENTR_v10003478 [Xenopus tropicalis]|nr:hypothetical protein XENTR_v10003478 [Xenopus tropicalis]
MTTLTRLYGIDHWPSGRTIGSQLRDAGRRGEDYINGQCISCPDRIFKPNESPIHGLISCQLGPSMANHRLKGWFTFTLTFNML